MKINNMTLRVLSAVALIPLVVGVYSLGGFYWWGFLGLLTAGMAYEWFTITQNTRPLLWAAFMGVLLVLFLMGKNLLWLGVFAALHAALTQRGKKAAALLAGPGIMLPVGCLALIADYTGLALFWLVLTVWATDGFAMLAGRAIGGPKLAPAISPQKTWAGLMGGIGGSALVTWTFFALLPGLPGALWAYAILFPVLAQGGDLLESRLKRAFGVKDSGRIIPGHGGILDRADSFLLTAPALWLLLSAGALSFS